jgi:hypothetical protein
MDQDKYDGADYVCDNCGSEIMVKHTGDGEKHRSLNYICRCGTEMRSRTHGWPRDDRIGHVGKSVSVRQSTGNSTGLSHRDARQRLRPSR